MKIYKREDCYVVFADAAIAGVPCYPRESKKYAEVSAYIAEHPEALVPEPTPPEPTPEELAAQAKAAILAELASLSLIVPRSLEDLYAATGQTPFNDPNVPSSPGQVIARKIVLRAQLATF